MSESEADTTLIRRGREAVTFSEMASFVRDLEQCPVARLLEDIPALAIFPDAKFNLAKMILRRRFRGEIPVDQLQLQSILREMADGIDDVAVADRVRTLFDVEVG